MEATKGTKRERSDSSQVDSLDCRRLGSLAPSLFQSLFSAAAHVDSLTRRRRRDLSAAGSERLHQLIVLAGQQHNGLTHTEHRQTMTTIYSFTIHSSSNTTALTALLLFQAVTVVLCRQCAQAQMIWIFSTLVHSIHLLSQCRLFVSLAMIVTPLLSIAPAAIPICRRTYRSSWCVSIVAAASRVWLLPRRSANKRRRSCA